MPVVVSTPPALQGPPGQQGQGIAIQGTVNSSADLPATGNVGDVWITADTGHGWSWDERFQTWIDIGPMQGPPGNNGTAATVAVGTTVTGPAGSQANVTNSGTTEAAVFNFTIPTGNTGAQGATGATGSTGPPGAPSIVPGPPGAKGDPGDAGPQGPAGPASTVPGPQGPAGATGAQGPQGNPGAPGSQGPAGPTGTSTTADFTIPPPSTAVTVQVADSSWMRLNTVVTFANFWGSFLVQTIPSSTSVNLIYLTTGAGGTGPVAGRVVPSGTAITFGPVLMPADTQGAGLLKQISGNTTDFVDGTNACQPLAAAVQPVIWSVRLRSFNAIDNPNFEVDQRNVGNLVTNPGTATLPMDRWTVAKVPAVNTNWQKLNAVIGNIVVPGTSFAITGNYLRITNQAVVSPGATDLFGVQQVIEGIRFRELSNDVHSISVMVRCSVANLKFGLALRDSPGSPAHSLTKLCQHSATPNTWILIPLANLPIWTAAGTFSVSPGVAAYTLAFGLMAGSSMMAPANDTWQNGNFTGAVGQDNFCAQPVGTTFDIAFVQHEPGPLCTTLQDLDWATNYDRCLRYYTKSYLYATAIAAVTAQGRCGLIVPAGFLSNAVGTISYPKPMARVPSVMCYSDVSGVANAARDQAPGLDRTATVQTLTEKQFSQLLLGTASTSGALITCHYAADTGW